MTDPPPIPFNRPYVSPSAYDAMADAARRGHLSGDGHYTRRASDLLQSITGVDRALLTTSCTHALEMCALLLDLGPGDEVVMPSFTFVSTANAFALRGARPVFVDIDPHTFDIDPASVAAAVTDRTRAIVVVHYAGVSCAMQELADIADRHGIALVEDNAHGLGASYRGRPLGSLGAMATLSFHETKNIHCGEGGALLLNDPVLIERAEIIREKGTDRSRFFRGQVDKYSWVSLGSSYLMSDLLAAFLTTQLEEFDTIQQARQDIWKRYAAELRDWADDAGFATQHVPAECDHPAHLFALLAPSLAVRTRFIDHMKAAGIAALFHYVPLHSSPQGRAFGACSLPVTDDVAGRLVRLPLYPDLSPGDVDRVVAAATAFTP